MASICKYRFVLLYNSMDWLFLFTFNGLTRLRIRNHLREKTYVSTSVNLSYVRYVFDIMQIGIKWYAKYPCKVVYYCENGCK